MGRRRLPLRQLTSIPIIQIRPRSGSPPVAPEAVQRLAQALERQGQREPLLVTDATSDAASHTADSRAYRLISGQRRLLAAQLLGWETLDCIVLGSAFAPELQVIAKLQESNFDPWELADTLRRLGERCGWTQAQLGMAIGKNRDFVASTLAIAKIGPEVRSHIRNHQNGYALSARHLRYVGRTAPARQLQAADDILAHRLSTKTLELRFRRRSGRRQYLKVRTLRQAGSSATPETTKEWRKYFRQITTDLRRIDQQEALEARRTAETIEGARQRQRLIKSEAKLKRQTLMRELRRATRQLTRRRAL